MNKNFASVLFDQREIAFNKKKKSSSLLARIRLIADIFPEYASLENKKDQLICEEIHTEFAPYLIEHNPPAKILRQLKERVEYIVARYPKMDTDAADYENSIV